MFLPNGKKAHQMPMVIATARPRAEADQISVPAKERKHKNNVDKHSPNVLVNANRTSTSFGDLQERNGTTEIPRNRETK